MSKAIERKCPKCGVVSSFRSDQKTCGSSYCKELKFPQDGGKNPVDSLEISTKKLLLGKELSLEELSDKLGVSPKTAKAAVKRLQSAGHNVKLTGTHAGIVTKLESGNIVSVNSKDFFDGKRYKFGALGDTHLYSKYARLDVLNCLYDIYEKEGITTVFHTGNIVEGECRFNKFDLVGPAGMGRAVDYCVQNYPQRKGITTHFITGEDHEGWWIQREGVNIGQYIQMTAENAGRKDLKWIGHVEADVHLKAKEGEAWMRIMHPGGGSAYAISYTEQKIVESFQGGEKPHILLIGHYHKFNQGYPREVHTVQTGCTQDQTPFLRRQKIQVHVGGSIVRYHQADTGEINRFSVEFMPFYDRKFYEKNDKYSRWS